MAFGRKTPALQHSLARTSTDYAKKRRADQAASATSCLLPPVRGTQHSLRVGQLKALNGCQLGAPKSARSSRSTSSVHYFAFNHRQLLSEQRSPTPAPPFLVTAVARSHSLTPTCSQIHALIDIKLLMANNESGQTEEQEHCKS